MIVLGKEASSKRAESFSVDTRIGILFGMHWESGSRWFLFSSGSLPVGGDPIGSHQIA